MLDMHTVKPLDREAVISCVERCGKIVTVEDHNIINGMGAQVACVVAQCGKGRMRIMGIQDQFGMSAQNTAFSIEVGNDDIHFRLEKILADFA